MLHKFTLSCDFESYKVGYKDKLPEQEELRCRQFIDTNVREDDVQSISFRWYSSMSMRDDEDTKPLFLKNVKTSRNAYSAFSIYSFIYFLYRVTLWNFTTSESCCLVAQIIRNVIFDETYKIRIEQLPSGKRSL